MADFYRAPEIGAFIDPAVPGLTAQMVIELLPVRKRASTRAGSFATAVVDHVATMRSLLAEDSHAPTTAYENKTALENIEFKLHEAARSIEGLSGASALFELVESHTEYLLIRAR